MRKTREELLQEFPSWNENRHDIVKINYGDEPLICWNEEKYKEYSKLTGTLANIEAVAAYMYTQNGNYNTYRTLIGDVHIKEDGIVLAGNVNIKFRGKIYSIILNRMYGWNALTILKLGKKVVGFSNEDGQGSPAKSFNTEEMSKNIVEKIINDPLMDYGEGIQKFMEAVREIYNINDTNYIMEKCFGA